MKSSAAAECRKWHSEWPADELYDFREELIKYCLNDVKILTMSIMKFRQLFIELTEIDPITRNFTLASVGLEYYRAKCLNENEIGITPTNGYINGRHKSMRGNIWLEWQEKHLGKKISREYKIGPYYADGYIEEDKHAFEYFGCFYHGCTKCY